MYLFIYLFKQKTKKTKIFCCQINALFWIHPRRRGCDIFMFKTSKADIFQEDQLRLNPPNQVFCIFLYVFFLLWATLVNTVSTARVYCYIQSVSAGFQNICRNTCHKGKDRPLSLSMYLVKRVKVP